MGIDSRIKVIGRKIRAIRKSKGLSQEQLAELAGLHPTYISDIENGKVNASLQSYLAVASGLEMPLGELIDLPEGKADQKIEDGIGELLSTFRKLPKTKQRVFLSGASGLIEGVKEGK